MPNVMLSGGQFGGSVADAPALGATISLIPLQLVIGDTPLSLSDGTNMWNYRRMATDSTFAVFASKTASAPLLSVTVVLV